VCGETRPFKRTIYSAERNWNTYRSGYTPAQELGFNGVKEVTLYIKLVSIIFIMKISVQQGFKLTFKFS
jgi:hypothetical protein